MDIRCENCQTEYELSEDRLKPEGVTVKCTSCGHMFRVRRRVTAEGVAPAPGLDLAERRRRASSIDGERTWLVRVEDGEIMTCRELATLQEWIAAGAVTRAAEISRTGKKWKKLGDIPELASFFQVADEAGAAARIARNDQWNTPTPVPSAHPRLVRVGGSGAAKLGDQGRAQSAVPGAVKRRGTAPARKPPSTPPVVRLPAAAAAGSVPPPMEPEPAPAPDPLAATASSPIVGGDGRGSPVAVAPATRAPAMRPPLANGAGAVHPGAMPPPATGPGAPPAVAPSRPRFGLAARDIGETGPTGGMARGVPTDDVAFAGGKIRPLKDSFGASASAPDFRDSASLDRPPRRRLGWIIALGSLVIIGGAVAVVYLYVFRPHGPAGEATVVPMVDAAPVVVEAAVDAAPAAAANRNEVLASARAALFADVALNLSAEAQKLAALPGADADAENLALRSRIEATLAEKATRSQAPDARKVSIAHLDEAKKLAEAALTLDRASPAAMAAKADVLRLSGERVRVVERWIRKAPTDTEAMLVGAKLAIEQHQFRDAEKTLQKLAARGGGPQVTGDVRPIFWLAVLAEENGDKAAAVARANKVLAISPAHAGAKALLDRATVQASSEDPMPPASPDLHPGPENEPAAENLSYQERVKRADHAAETGNCGTARGLYERALELNPAGVEALTGLGYCLLDARNFAGAHAKFRAALGISPGYQEALYGTAEAYQQQGDVDAAISAYRRYLDKHPQGARAEMAKRNLEKLGGAGEPDDTGEPPPPAETNPPSGEPPPEADPAESPASEASPPAFVPASPGEAPGIDV